MRIVGILFSLLILTGCGGGTDEEASSTEPTTTNDAVSEAAAPFVSVPVADLSTEHVDTPPVSFDHSPAIGGAHYPFWQNCGFYETEVIEGAAAHTLEHGAVWVTYNAELMSPDDLATLEALSESNGRLLISPYPHDEALVLSAWGVQQRVEAGPDDAAVGEFIAQYQDNPELAEANVSCVGAVGIPPSRPASWPDGGEVPEEFR